MKKNILLIVILLSISGCTHRYIGKKFPRNPGTDWLSDTSGHHYVTKKHLIFDYDYTIDKDDLSVRVQGSTMCNFQNVTDWDQAKMLVYFFLFDKDMVVTDYKSFFLGDFYDGDSLCEEREFDITSHKSPGLHGILWGYSLQARQ